MLVVGVPLKKHNVNKVGGIIKKNTHQNPLRFKSCNLLIRVVVYLIKNIINNNCIKIGISLASLDEKKVPKKTIITVYIV